MKQAVSMLLTLSLVLCLFTACGSQPAAEVNAESAQSAAPMDDTAQVPEDDGSRDAEQIGRASCRERV